FIWEGKPLILANPEQTPEALRDKFTFRTAYWPTFGMHNTHDAWHWVAAYPQPYSWTKDEKTPEQVNVSTAQNLARTADAPAVWMSEGVARGRSFAWGDKEDALVSQPEIGRNFAQQWERAYELDPPFVMITGWNEWIAGRWTVGPNRKAYVDQFNQEYSRDVEPTRGMHFDNYYLQMVDGVRKYKGTPRNPSPAARKTIDIDAGFAQWADVEPTFKDYVNETKPRDFVGVGGTAYKNDSGRNDLVAMKATRDDEFAYFYVETREAIVPADFPNGLELALDLDGDLNTGWRGADLLVGRNYTQHGGVSAELYGGAPGEKAGAWKTSAFVGVGRYALDGNKFQIAIPLSVFKDGADVRSIRFKWLDNVPLDSPEDLYEKGDVAPESSFFYRVDFAE
ncbi:MAG: hypothetical protein HUK22_02780, partial [Thermoguttaceae bacterium]|nr:hypothetical protein [Thermoguttaceae bacterium]